MKLGDVIYSYRKRNNMSMDEFAKRSGISKAYISLLEKGNHPVSGKPIIPSVKTIKKAAYAMSVNFEELFSSLDQDISVEEITEPQFDISVDGRWEVIYNGFRELSEGQQERLLEYFKAIIETERNRREE